MAERSATDGQGRRGAGSRLPASAGGVAGGLRGRPGATVYLELAELGAEGPAEVLAVEPCPAIGPAPSDDCRLITGTFAHSSGEILDLMIEGLAEPIGCTANHPFWSENRQAFVPAGEAQRRRNPPHRRRRAAPRRPNHPPPHVRARLQP